MKRVYVCCLYYATVLILHMHPVSMKGKKKKENTHVHRGFAWEHVSQNRFTFNSFNLSLRCVFCSDRHLICSLCLDEFNYLAVKQSYAAYAFSEILVWYLHGMLINVEDVCALNVCESAWVSIRQYSNWWLCCSLFGHVCDANSVLIQWYQTLYESIFLFRHFMSSQLIT